MHDRVNTIGAMPATVQNGAPTTDEIMRAFDVPEHRRARVDAALADLLEERRAAGHDVTVGIMAGIHVPGSRGDRALHDRMRHLAGEGGAIDLVDSGAARIIVREAGLAGVIALSGALYKVKAGDALDAWRMIGPRFIGQALFDAVIGGTRRIDGVLPEDLREDAHGYVDWLRLMHQSGPTDLVDVEMLTEWDDLMDAAGIDRVEAANLLFDVVQLVERVGPYVPQVQAKPGTASVMEAIFAQLELGDILTGLHAKPQVVEAIQQRRRERRALSRQKAVVRSARPLSQQMLLDLLTG